MFIKLENGKVNLREIN